jgi:23S rRNA (adenine2030-N6)-methyltransferase
MAGATMNYRHIYHAGNFADVLKHTILTLMIEYLKRKEKPFRVIDTHAGTGLYDLSSEEAQRTGEWRGGIGLLREAKLSQAETDLLAPLLDCVQAVNAGADLNQYPGSAMIARHLLRKQDRLTAIELHPADAETLRSHFEGDFQTRITELDGWLALGAHLPPKEKRGLVLVDPPFEKEGEFDRLVKGLAKAHRRWPGGIYAFWYPIKNLKDVASFRLALADSGIPDILDVSLEVAPVRPDGKMSATGMIIVNPPYLLHEQLQVILPAFARILGETGHGRYAIRQLTAERAAS